ncbi:ATP-binding protein [Streptomyces sp. NPDC001220]
MSTNQVDAPVRPAPTRGGIRGFADRWPFRRKLNLLVGVPLAVIAVLLAYVFTDLVQQSTSAEDAAQLVRDSTQVARLVDKVEAEHQQAILLSARYESGYSTPSQAAYRAAQEAVTAQLGTVRDTFGDRLPGTEADALRQVEGLSSLRDSVEQSYLPADNIDPAYSNAANDLIDGLGLDRNADLAATFTGNLLDSLLRADAAHGAFETNVLAATTGDTNALIEFTSAVGAYDLYQHQADRFTRFATEGQAAQLASVEHTKAQSRIAESYAELQIDPSRLQAGSQDDIRKAVTDALTDYPDYLNQATARLNITASLIGQIADRADATAGSAKWRAIYLLSGTLLGFVLWITLAALVRRSVIRPVQALTGVAHEVAEVAGRELARVADDDAEDAGPPRLRDMPVTARDEIGDLAEAFNQVQTTAAALLERQVLSRRNTAEMFGNVGRRVSNLTTRQLAFIDAVERAETDPALLERLYSIDHIAVRLRRNADSLMLLAGIRETVLASGPTPISNVVRAALGQIEGYQRVRLYAGTDVMIEPDIIGDLTLMVAELLENAVSFSPEGSPVEVTVRTGDDGAHIVVTDHGLGMSAERLAEENARLIRRERLDLVPTKVLGLFVVGALARRWEIGVELTRTPGGGVTAEVTLPSRLLLTMSALAGTSVTPLAVEPAAPTPPAAPAAPAAPTEPTGPTPAASIPAAAEPESPLPRRVPRREPAAEAEAAPAPLIPAARAGEPPADSADGPRPLRRRVRGATLRTTVGAAQTLAQPARSRDADAERDALEEFEAAVERARRESDTGSHERPAPPHPETNPPHHQIHLPEGAEQ